VEARIMAKTTKRARSVIGTATAAAPITAADVWDFSNPEDVQASNALVGGNIPDTLENCAVVLAFLSDYHARNSIGERVGADAGLNLVIEWVEDAIKKQASELEVDHGQD
jgi:hypothetical protein